MTSKINKFGIEKQGKSRLKPFVWTSVIEYLTDSNEIRVKGFPPYHVSQKEWQTVISSLTLLTGLPCARIDGTDTEIFHINTFWKNVLSYSHVQAYFQDYMIIKYQLSNNVAPPFELSVFIL